MGRLPWRRRRHRADAVKIFGIGTIKTGTTSLGVALKELGLQHTHERREFLLRAFADGDLETVYRWVDQHESFEDWPYPLMYRELDREYPNARFVLTRRTCAEVWLKSVLGHDDRVGPTVGRGLFFGAGSPTHHQDDYVRTYEAHLTAVRAHFADRPGKLLEVCWEEGDGWPELCSFLGVDQPSIEFPVMNSAANPLNK